MQVYWFLLGLLAVWRISHLLAHEDGPWQVIARLRLRAGSGVWGSLLDCFNCISLWVAAPFAFYIGNDRGERFCLWLAFSGAAILLDRLASHGPPPMPTYIEDGGHDRELLRENADTDTSKPPGTTG